MALGLALLPTHSHQPPAEAAGGHPSAAWHQVEGALRSRSKQPSPLGCNLKEGGGQTGERKATDRPSLPPCSSLGQARLEDFPCCAEGDSAVLPQGNRDQAGRQAGRQAACSRLSYIRPQMYVLGSGSQAAPGGIPSRHGCQKPPQKKPTKPALCVKRLRERLKRAVDRQQKSFSGM